LGCASNGTYVACSYGTSGTACGTVGQLKNALVLYDASGTIQYSSDCLFDGNSANSAPLINTSGDVIMADDKIIARIDYPYPSAGGYTWKTSLPGGGNPFSPTLIDDGTIVVIATKDPGYISAYWADTGVSIASTRVSGDPCSGGTCTYYETRNTPAASNTSPTRFYVSMNAIGSTNYGLLVALDVDTGGGGAINYGWGKAFGGPSGASPAVVGDVIYFDGSGQDHTYSTASGWFFAVEDTGVNSYGSHWSSDGVNVGAGRIPAAGSVDTTRSCVWVYLTPGASLYCVKEDDGSTPYSFSIRTYSSLTFAVPASDMSLTQISGGDTVMVVGVVKGIDGPTDPLPPVANNGHVVAVQLTGTGGSFSPSPYWEVTLPTVSSGVQAAAGQFPILTNSDGDQVVAFATTQDRAFFYWFH
jgi:hypothetical protein